MVLQSVRGVKRRHDGAHDDGVKEVRRVAACDIRVASFPPFLDV